MAQAFQGGSVLGHLLFLIIQTALLLAGAKAHGRQMRLERLAQGHAIQGFQRGVNPPWVEARWAWERRWFWGLYPLCLLLFYFGTGSLWAPLWGFILDLSLMGAVAWLRLEKDLQKDRAAIEARLGAAWIGQSRRDSALWWSLVAALGQAAFWSWLYLGPGKI